jgi:ribosomal protein S20
MAVVIPPQPDPPPLIEPAQIDLPPVPVATGASPRRERRRRSPVQANTPASAQTNAVDTPPAATSPEDAAIGALSLGGEANPRAQQEAGELLASIEKRLNSLSPGKAVAEKAQVSRIRNFQRQAQQALNSGDVEGAKTLATKAWLLLDDLEK